MTAKDMVRRAFLGGAVAVAMHMAAPGANALTVINFENPSLDGGTLTASGGGNFVGDDIIFTSVLLQVDGVATKGVQCGLVRNVANACLLDFDTATGDFTVTTQTGLYDIGPDVAEFTGDEGGQVLAANSLVLDGTISGFDDFGGILFASRGTDTKNEALLRFFGIFTNDFTFANTEIRAQGTTVVDADLINSIPEPGTLALFGLGLAALGRNLHRRRVSQRA